MQARYDFLVALYGEEPGWYRHRHRQLWDQLSWRFELNPIAARVGVVHPFFHLHAKGRVLLMFHSAPNPAS
ncbi:hypothetical protein C2E23DRAFT_799012 [Lenzites betulinus]|nr:hypothetical protein C2E23DRAFT_799012 [Lenzites betulinus]